MSRVPSLEDEELRNQLERRSKAVDAQTGSILADQLRARLTNEPQLPARPWDRWPSAPRSGVRGLRAILVGSAALLVIAIAGSLASARPGPAGHRWAQVPRWPRSPR